MKQSDQYITFLDRIIGRDGYRYIQNVKYRIWMETASAFYLKGKNGKFLNRIYKTRLRDRFFTGNIIRF
jgi:hypothetical protein